MKIRKRNRRFEDFSKSKIVASIMKASDSLPEDEDKIPFEEAQKLGDLIEEHFIKNKIDIIKYDALSTYIENKLMETPYKSVAKSYINYCYDRQKEYMFSTELYKSYEKKLTGKNIENSNANCDENSFSGRMNEGGRVFLRTQALKTMSKKFKDNHNNNLVYTHDIDSWFAGLHNCLSIPFDKLFETGVTIKQTDIRPPKSVGTAFQLIAVYMQIQSLEQFGGVASTHLDWTLVPFVRDTFFKNLKIGKKYIEHTDWRVPANCEKLSIDKYKNDSCYQYAYDMTVKEAHQSAEALIHNLNSLQSRSGQQLPFSSINYGTCTLSEGRMIIDAILDATLDGTGPLHKTPIFPCGIFQFDKDINGYEGTPNYDLFLKALKSTSKRFYPNYVNTQWTTDIAGRMKDVEHKRSVINKLNETKLNKLTEWVKNNAEEAYKYKMVIKDDKLIIDETIINPVEIMSTMGKCKLQLI